METTTSIQDMDCRRNIKVDVQAAKFDRLKHHPMNARMNDRNEQRLKRGSFVAKSRQNVATIKGDDRSSENITPSPNPIWKYNLPELRHDIPGIRTKSGNQSILERKCITNEYIADQFPEDKWTRIYTDGSADEATTN